VGDACRSRRELLVENAVLRHHERPSSPAKRPTLRLIDRPKLLLGSRLLRSWGQAIVVKPETVLRRQPSQLPPVLASSIPAKEELASPE